MISPQAFGERLLRDEAQLEVVPGKLIDSIDDIRQWRQIVPLVDAFDILRRDWRGKDRRVEDISAHLGGVALLGFIGPHSRVAVFAIVVGLAADGKDAGLASV